MQKDLEQWKIESGAFQKEELRHRYEKTMQEIRERRTAAGEKKLKAAQMVMEHRSTYGRSKQKNATYEQK